MKVKRNEKGNANRYLLCLITASSLLQSDLAETERSQLHASKEEEVSEFCVKPDEYLKMLMPPSSETER